MAMIFLWRVCGMQLTIHSRKGCSSPISIVLPGPTLGRLGELLPALPVTEQGKDGVGHGCSIVTRHSPGRLRGQVCDHTDGSTHSRHATCRCFTHRYPLALVPR